MTIYKITNIENKKVYIGKTIATSAERWQQHLYEAYNENCRSYNHVLHRAIRKYGADKFIVEDIDSASNEAELNEKEKFWIKFYRDNFGKINVYNVADGGDGGRIRAAGWHHTEESKKKMSESQKKIVHKRNVYHHSEETKQKIGAANSGTNNGMFGQHHTEETKLQISNKLHTIRLGTKHSEETKKKMSESHKGIFKNRLSINKDGIVKYIQEAELEYYLSNGWKRGTGRFKNK